VQPGSLPAPDDAGGAGSGAHAEAGAERDGATAGAPGAEAAVVYEYDAELIERRYGPTLPYTRRTPITPLHVREAVLRGGCGCGYTGVAALS